MAPGEMYFKRWVSFLRMLCNRSPYVKDFAQIANLDLLQKSTMIIHPEAKPANEHRRAHNANLHEVAFLLNEEANSEDIVVRKQGGQFLERPDTHRSYYALPLCSCFRMEPMDGIQNFYRSMINKN